MCPDRIHPTPLKLSASNPCKEDVAKNSSTQSVAMVSAGRQELPGLVWWCDGARGSGNTCGTTPRWFPRPWPRIRLSPPQSCPRDCSAHQYPPLCGENKLIRILKGLNERRGICPSTEVLNNEIQSTFRQPAAPNTYLFTWQRNNLLIHTTEQCNKLFFYTVTQCNNLHNSTACLCIKFRWHTDKATPGMHSSVHKSWLHSWNCRQPRPHETLLLDNIIGDSNIHLQLFNNENFIKMQKFWQLFDMWLSENHF